MNLNRVILVGRVSRDPEVTYTTKGTAVCNLGIAVNEFFGTGENRTETTTFLEATLWAKTAENAAKFLKKGQLVSVEGRLSIEKWTTREGAERSRLKVTAERVQFGPKAGSAAENDEGGRRKDEAEPAAASEKKGDGIPF